MKYKRLIVVRKVYKWNDCLKIHGKKQQYGVKYWDNNDPVVNYNAIQLVLILSIMIGWHTNKIYFVLDYPQASVYIPKVFAFKNPYPLNPEKSDLFYFLLIRTKLPKFPKL